MKNAPDELESYRTLADGGNTQFIVRLAIGAYIAAASYLLAPSITPLIWFVTMVMSQIASAAFLRGVICAPGAKLTLMLKIATPMVMAMASLCYTWIAAYIWFHGAAGQIFAEIIVLGSLLHIVLYRKAVRAVFVAACICPCLVLFGLPILSAVHAGSPSVLGCVIMLMAGALYLFHLSIAVGQSHRLTSSLKSANRSKSAFLATLTHEIRTPLNAVTSAAHLLGRTPLTEAQKEHVAILLNGSEILLSLINDVLDMSKIEAGKLEAEIGDVDLAALTEKVAALWAPKSAERGLKLAVVAEPELPRLIRTDALRLNQILFNLISNAVKFTAEGGVTLLVSRVEGGPDDGGRGATKSHDPVAHPTPEGAWLRFEVTDTGPGMSREVLGRLFKSFEQADARVALRYGGTGLGLAISSKLAGLLGGRLTVKSELGAGSTFQLDIPLVSPEVSVDRVPEVGAAPPAVSANAGLSILLAEDHPINRRLVDLILQPIGWDLTMVENGAEAVEMAIRRPFDVILLDMQMPVMSGLEAEEAIRAGAGPNATTPIAALTANAFEDQRLCWKAAGAEGFLTKPINPALLIETIAALAAARGPCPTAAAPLEGPSVPSAA